MRTDSLTVCYIITKLELGGAQKVCLELGKNLRANGHQSCLISGAEGPLVAQLPDYFPDQAQVILLDSFKREVSLASLKLEWRNWCALIKQLRQLKTIYPDLIVHTHSTKAGLVGRWAAWRAGIKRRVHTIHGYGFNRYQPKIVALGIYLLELITSLITTDYVCVSELDLKTGTKLFPGFKSKAQLIRAAVDDALFRGAKTISRHPECEAKHSVSKGIFTLGTVACFKPQKNLIDLLRAFNYLKTLDPDTNYQLEIVGDGVQRTELEQWLLAHNLTQSVILHGWLTPTQLLPIMQRWQLFTLTSLWEGLPCAIVEARCLKLPVLVYNAGGISELIHAGQNGWLYTPGDWRGLAQGVYKLAHDRALYQQFSNYPDNLTAYSYQAMTQAHIALYLKSPRLT